MSEDIEARAKELGWAPKEEFRGDPEKWIDAETFVKRGEEMMPLLRANNKKLSEDLTSVRAELKKTNDLLTAAQESIEALKEFNSAANRKAAKEAADATKAALIEAKKEGDVEKEIELTTQLQEQHEAIKEAEKASKQPKKPNGAAATEPDPTQTKEWKEWSAENTWFGKDKRRTALAMGIADELRASEEGSGLVGRAFLDKVTEEVEKVFGDGAPRVSKVEGGGPSSSNAGSGRRGKSYSDLPDEAKSACERQAGRLVGPGRAFKSQEEWRKHYAETYFAEE